MRPLLTNKGAELHCIVASLQPIKKHFVMRGTSTKKHFLHLVCFSLLVLCVTFQWSNYLEEYGTQSPEKVSSENKNDLYDIDEDDTPNIDVSSELEVESLSYIENESTEKEVQNYDDVNEVEAADDDVNEVEAADDDVNEVEAHDDVNEVEADDDVNEVEAADDDGNYAVTDDDVKKDETDDDVNEDEADDYDETPSHDGNEAEPITVAYAASFIHCEMDDFSTYNSAAGLIDGSLVLRHSIHKISSRNPDSGSKYDYKMYALVHRTQAIKCVDMIEKLGFEVVIVDPPFEVENIVHEHVRENIPRSFCCGHHEFIKLHAFNLTEEIFVHVDLDFAFHKPMDHLFDALLYDKDSKEGKAAREKIQRELHFPDEAKIPDDIAAYWTRDWGQVAPERNWKSGFQGGFLVGKRDPTIITDVSNVVLTTNYTAGYSGVTGWADKGYADYIVGAMAIQGVMAYFYDEIRPSTTVELNECLYNHLGMDTTYQEGGPWFNARWGVTGKCRDSQDTCDQCKFTPIEDIYNIHYSPCGKPWHCITQGEVHQQGFTIDVGMCDLDHCFELQHLWHSIRSDLEDELLKRKGHEMVKELSAGDFRRDIFAGHCRNETDYISLLEASDEIGDLVSEFYTTT